MGKTTLALEIAAKKPSIYLDLEDEANTFASNLLIPNHALVALMRERPLPQSRIWAFSEEWQISPGIVVAQLQKHSRLPMVTQFNNLKRFSFDLTAI